MKKIVNINSPASLYIFTPPLSGVMYKQELSLGDIKYCLLNGAKVSEILKDGSEVKLTLNNYDKDNSIKKDIKKEVKTSKSEIKEPIKEEFEPELKSEEVLLDKKTTETEESNSNEELDSLETEIVESDKEEASDNNIKNNKKETRKNRKKQY